MANPHFGEDRRRLEAPGARRPARPAAPRAVLGDARGLGHLRARPVVGARVRRVHPAAGSAARTGDQRVPVPGARARAAGGRRGGAAVPGVRAPRDGGARRRGDLLAAATSIPASVADLTRTARELDLADLVRVERADGLATIWARAQGLAPEAVASTFALLDPFDETERSADDMDALDLFARLAAGGFPTVLWHGYGDTDDRDAIRARGRRRRHRDADARHRDRVPARGLDPEPRRRGVRDVPREPARSTPWSMRSGSVANSRRATTRC